MDERRKREDSLGTEAPYLPIPRRGYMCDMSFIAANKSIAKPPAHIRRRHTRHVWPEAIHVHNPDVDERILRESSLGSTAPYIPIPRRGYICEAGIHSPRPRDSAAYRPEPPDSQRHRHKLFVSFAQNSLLSRNKHS
ncbi:hypothetical protein [uncultured Muribaculum sp.]|uniref:hypothetical protein n=1 Tax=uncultured Muribaculum sp. TaxID=1918613 RepID=UPI0025B0754B|nr:hypothetical protein [uncultured Muribaculum sp.]